MDNYIVFTIYNGYITFRDTKNRTGSNPIVTSINDTIALIKSSLGIDDHWRSETITVE